MLVALLATPAAFGFILLARRCRRRLQVLSLPDDVLMLSGARQVFLIWYIGWAFIGVVVGGIESAYPTHIDSLSINLLASFLSFLVITVGIVLEMKQRTTLRWKVALAAEWPRNAGKYFFLAFVLGGIFASIGAGVLLTRDIQPDTPMAQMIQQNESEMAFLFLLIMAITMAPIFEELIFRGYVYDVLRRTLGLYPAVAIVAGLFGLMHVHQYWTDWAGILLILLFGLSLTWMRAWSRSLWPCIFMCWREGKCLKR
jgi:membrane protease YdiL (CAAX protease family)